MPRYGEAAAVGRYTGDSNLARAKAVKVAGLLKTLIKARGLTMAAACRQIGVSYDTINRISSHDAITNTTLVKIQAWAAKPAGGQQ